MFKTLYKTAAVLTLIGAVGYAVAYSLSLALPSLWLLAVPLALVVGLHLGVILILLGMAGLLATVALISTLFKARRNKRREVTR